VNDENTRHCKLCGSEHLITFHHLIPKSCHTNKWFKKNFTKQEMTENGVDLCRKCHSFIHKQFSEKTLGRELNTLEKLQANEVIAKYAKWAIKKTGRTNSIGN